MLLSSVVITQVLIDVIIANKKISAGEKIDIGMYVPIHSVDNTSRTQQ